MRTALLILAWLSLLSSCGQQQAGSAADSASLWTPGIDDQAILTERGQLRHGRNEFLTLWYGMETERLKIEAPPYLSDNRDAVLVKTPTQFYVDLAASPTARQLTTAVRRTQAHPTQAVHCEVFWQVEQKIQSLGTVLLDPAPELVSEAWHELVLDLPLEAGRLQFISRDASPTAGNQAPSLLAWMAPRVESKQSKGTLPDVLLLTIDTLRADALEHAPKLAARLQQGAFWPRAVAPSNWTLPAYGSLFTGLAADQHGAGRGSFTTAASGTTEDRQLSPLNPELPTLAQHFRQAGYATAMVHQNPMLESWAGMAKGFEQYVRASARNADALQWAEGWWQNNEHRPRFLVVHLMAPHLPYRFGPEPDPLKQLHTARFFREDHSPEQRQAFFDLPPDSQDRVRTRYAIEVSRLDQDLEPFLERLLNRQTRATVFAFHADHGEELWDAGSFEHGHSFDDSVIRVPIALQMVGDSKPRLHPEAVPAYGLSGSLLDLVGLDHEFTVTLQSSPKEFSSSMPLFRSNRGGRVFSADQTHDLAFDPGSHAGGPPAMISPAQLRMLQELGYLAQQELKPTAKEK